MPKVLDLAEANRLHRQQVHGRRELSIAAPPLESRTVEGEVRLSLSLPASVLSPNSRAHWALKARAVKKHRSEAKTLAWCAINQWEGFPWTAATIELTFYFRHFRVRDKDNLLACGKSAIDGIADAGVVENDSAFTFLPVRVFIDKQRPRLELILRKTE